MGRFLPRTLPRVLPRNVYLYGLILGGGPPGSPLDYIPFDTEDSIGLSVSDYANVDPILRDVFFIDADNSRPAAEAYTLALASPLLNTGDMIGTHEKGVALYDMATTRHDLNISLEWFGLPIVGGWWELEYFTEADWFVY